MRMSQVSLRSLLIIALVSLMLLPGLGEAYSTGIGGTQTNAGESIDDVAKEGCLCHDGAADNTVQVIMDGVPYSWVAGETYEMTLYLIGGPNSAADLGGFSMRVSAGSLTEGAGMEYFDEDVTTLTHSSPTAPQWDITWVAPEAGSGHIDFWISGNSINGADGNVGDYWNQLVFNLVESSEDDGLGTRTIFAGDGNVEPPSPDSHGVDLHSMGAQFRAHWLGLLGFGAVISVIIFCGIMLRYGFSTSYEGRSNVLRLRYKLNRRGDQ